MTNWFIDKQIRLRVMHFYLSKTYNVLYKTVRRIVQTWLVLTVYFTNKLIFISTSIPPPAQASREGEGMEASMLPVSVKVQ